ncbi:MAG: NTP transferase domain-containing protein, partial [Spirochaetia bacterium]|nr:NTP transferase domain-containing protein [Spirochaetia bacterium]
MITSQNKAAVVLAAGKGTRMKSELPKVAIPVSGKPMIQYVLENLRKSGIQDVVIVVGYKREDVIRL